MKKQFMGWFILLSGGLMACNLQAAKQIAITFDDAPRADTSLTSAIRTEELMIGLQISGVEQAMFFVTTKHVNENNKGVLQQYQKDGHLIANHSDQHLWLHKTDVASYQQDFLKAHEQLQSYEHFRPFFRYPYLDEGRDKRKVKAMQKFLSKQGYQNGYVTVDNYDWYLDKLYQDAHQAGLKIDMNQMKNLYVDVLFGAITFYDDMAIKYLGRSPKHVLLLHENDLAAKFVSDLVERLKAEGWEIISPLEAYQDPIAQQLPKTLFTGQGRVAALARDAGAKPKELVHEAEDEAHLKKLFEDYQVATRVGAALPDWLKKEMENQVGTWKASNAQYHSATEPFTEFVVEWNWGIGNHSLDGRLYGLIDGEPTDDFWVFKQFWDSEKNQARLLQFGYGGRVGDGFLRPIGQGQIETIQVFSAPNIKPFEERHLNLLTPDGLLTTSFNKSEQGEWQGRRSYTWIKQQSSTD